MRDIQKLKKQQQKKNHTHTQNIKKKEYNPQVRCNGPLQGQMYLNIRTIVGGLYDIWSNLALSQRRRKDLFLDFHITNASMFTWVKLLLYLLLIR